MLNICWKINFLKIPPTSVITTGFRRSREAQAAAVLGWLAPHLPVHVQSTSVPHLRVSTHPGFLQTRPWIIGWAFRNTGIGKGENICWSNLCVWLNELASYRVATCLRGGVEYDDIDPWHHYVTLGHWTPSDYFKYDIILLLPMVPCLSPLVFLQNKMGVLVIMVLSSATETLSAFRAVSCLVTEWNKEGKKTQSITSLLPPSKFISTKGEL